MVKLRDIALVAGVLAGGYFLLRGGEQVASDIQSSLSGFAGSVSGGIGSIFGGGGPSGDSNSGAGTPTGGSNPNPPPGTNPASYQPFFPYSPIPSGVGAIGPSIGNIGVGAGILTAGIYSRKVIGPVFQRVGNFVRNYRSATSPNIEDLTTEISPATLGEEAALPGVFPFSYNDIQRAGTNLSKLTGRPNPLPAPPPTDAFGLTRGSPGDLLVKFVSGYNHRPISRMESTHPDPVVHTYFSGPPLRGPGRQWRR